MGNLSKRLPTYLPTYIHDQPSAYQDVGRFCVVPGIWTQPGLYKKISTQLATIQPRSLIASS